MARLVTKFKYLKPDQEKPIGGYATYIATREGVEKIDESFKLAPATVKQQKLIEKILRDFPDSAAMLEYEDYQREKTMGTATEFITRAIEDNAHEILNQKTYADYIGTRPGAERFGNHGLFTDDGVQVKLKEVSQELNAHQGNVWTLIISLRREDAERLGFNTGVRWRDMLRTQTQALADSLKIPMDHLKWYAAFHNESHHPHIHLLAYSTVEKEGFLTKQGVAKMRSSLAKDIFEQDLLCIYEKQTVQRDKLRLHSKELIAEIVSRINAGTYDNPKVEELLLRLADRLSKTKGKKVYGYLKADVKALVDAIVDELAADEKIAALYNLWYEQKEEALQVYTEALPQRVPLSQNKEFKPIKNAVIQEALGLHADQQDVEEPAQADAPDPEMPEAPESDSQASDPIEPDPPPGFRSYSGGWGWKKDTWWTNEYKAARAFLYGTKTSKPDFEQSLTRLKEEALRGNGFAMHDLGKMVLAGLGCKKDEEQAQEWFRKAFSAFCAREPKEEKPGYLRYRIGKMYAFGYGVDQNYLKAAEWYEKSVAEGNPFAAYALGSLYHRGQGVEQDEEKAFALFTMAATDEDKPNAYAQYELGRMCRNGIGTAPDQAASEQWYKQAYQGFLKIEQDMADDKLYYRLGQMNLTGTGTKKDPEQARMYFEKAAELGNADAMYGLGKLYLSRDFSGRDVKKAIDYLMAAAGKDHDYAMYTLGKLFLEGKEIPKNPEYALRWLEEAVEKENPYAEYLLGKTLLQGVDLPQDIHRAVSLLEKAAARSNPCAAYALGKALLEGTVLLQNLPRAMELLTFSADQGFSAAQYLLGKVFSSGELLTKDIPKAILYLTRAAEQDHEYAQYLLGKLYLADEGIPKDVNAALYWFTRAADQGNAFAQYQLGKLFLYGREVEQDMEKAISYLTASADQGNVYAAQLLQSVHSNRNWSAALGSLRLLQHLARIIQNRIEDERKGGKGGIDRKLKRKIDEKKQAHGLKQG